MRPPRRTAATGFAAAIALLTLAIALACAPDQTAMGPERVRPDDLPVAFSHGTFPTTTGIYRIPYADGLTVEITKDHHDHNPVNRIDMSGDLAGFPIVAAASGRIRAILDHNGNSNNLGDGLAADGVTPQFDNLEHSCQDDDSVVGNCSDYNNYVWIEHPNGEWTKYTHFRTRSVTNNGWSVGDWIEAGEILGIESDIGRATGRHLHFEVGLPDDPAAAQPFTALGGFMVPGFGVNLVPFVCDVPNNLYDTGDSYVAGPCDHLPPAADAGGPYTVTEGSVVLLNGTGSIDPEGLDLTYLWAPDTDLDDVSDPTPLFTGIDDAIVDLTLTVYDMVEALSSSDETTVTVTNVTPSVTIEPTTPTSIDEGATITVKAAFSDPGLLDSPFTSEVICRDITGYELTVPGTLNVTSTAGPVRGTVEASCPNGDTSQSGNPPAGTFQVTVRVTDKDGATGEASFNLTVRNVTPTPTLSMAGTTVINGASTFLAQVGEPVDFSGNVTDPASDDLFLTWDWGDGSVDSATYRRLPILPDPFPSPTSNPRNVTDLQSHTWGGACFYEMSLTATDDDGGQDQDAASVIIIGNSGRARGVGYWLTHYRGSRSTDFDQATLACYLAIAGYMSAVFDEGRAGTGSFAQAADVLHVGGDQGDMRYLLDQQLIGVWLNFANGAFQWDELVDTTGDGIPDTALSAALTAAESVRLDPASSRAQLEAAMRALEAINLMHGG